MTEYRTDFDRFHEQFTRLERDLSLFDLTVNGIPVWERLREGVKIDLLARMGVTGEANNGGSSLRTRLRGSYLLTRNVVMRNPFLGCQAAVAFFGHPRRKEQSDTWTDIYCDPLHETGVLNAIHLEPPWKFGHFRPTQTPNLRYTDLIEYLGQANTYFGLVGETLSPQQRARTERAQERFEDAFDVQIDLTGEVRTVLARRAARKPFYDRLLARVDPNLAVIVAHSGRETFIEACHDADIPVAELQHGQISPYSYQHAFPGDRTKEAYPDYLLTFGEFWETAASLPLESDRVIPVGYPYLERELTERQPLEQGQQVVFISTPEAGPVLSKIAADLSTRPDILYECVYKLHPDELDRWEIEYPWLADAPLSVVAQDGPSLYDLFAESSVQVGVGSTALYEGLAFELATYLVRQPTIEWLAPVIEAGEATVVESADDLAEQLAEPDHRSIEREKYFRPDAVENAISVIERLVETGTVRE